MRLSTPIVPFNQTSTSQRRGSIAASVLAATALLSLATVAAFSVAGLHSSNSTSAKNAATGKAERRLRPGEVAVVLHLLGIHPESLAAAGVTGIGCDGIFDVGMVYGLQAERLDQLQLAHKNVNLASEKAVRPASPGAVDNQGNQIPLIACQTALSNLEVAGWQFVTTGLVPGVASKLATIKANRHWGLPAPYLTVNRTDEQWLALRGALCARRYATQHNEPLAPALAQILADAEGDPTVAQALTDSASHLVSVSQSWSAHEVAP